MQTGKSWRLIGRQWEHSAEPRNASGFWAMMLVGFCGLAFARFRRKRASAAIA